MQTFLHFVSILFSKKNIISIVTSICPVIVIVSEHCFNYIVALLDLRGLEWAPNHCISDYF